MYDLCRGKKYCKPEIDTSEMIADFRWHFLMDIQWHCPIDCQWHVPTEFHCSAVCSKGLSRREKSCGGALIWHGQNGPLANGFLRWRQCGIGNSFEINHPRNHPHTLFKHHSCNVCNRCNVCNQWWRFDFIIRHRNHQSIY